MRDRRTPLVLLPALMLVVAGMLTYLNASGAFKFIGLMLCGAAFLAGVWGVSHLCRPKTGRMLRGIVLALILLGGMSFAVLEGVVLSGDRTDLQGEPQVMVILGAQVKPWGPSVLLKDRLDTALIYLEDHPDLTIVVSGGQGRDEHISEAQCMYDYLTAHGVDGGQILLEDQSHNTWENISNTFVLLKDRGYEAQMDQVVVVSNGFHLARVRMLWDRVWGENATLSTLAAPSSDLSARINSYLREAPALLKSWVLDR